MLVDVIKIIVQNNLTKTCLFFEGYHEAKTLTPIKRFMIQCYDSSCVSFTYIFL